MESEKNN